MPGFRKRNGHEVGPDARIVRNDCNNGHRRISSMNRQHRKPRAIAIARAQEAETALRRLALICLGASATLTALAFAFIG